MLKQSKGALTGLRIEPDEIAITQPLILLDPSAAGETELAASAAGEEVQELAREPLFVGKSFVIPDKLRVFKNTDGGNIPWSTSTTATAGTKSAKPEKVIFFETKAKPPPNKRERQHIPGIRTKDLNKTAKKAPPNSSKPQN